ncbi:DUF4355 domain-containing protein [Weissella cibaria]|uniref:DUF4355 domain-containing protein n=1 Tax=Weissella cibaria TaxID=137591 RepID=UPI000ED6F753|nr:DUF4355 domain-containing protein [Weissella cibaria]
MAEVVEDQEQVTDAADNDATPETGNIEKTFTRSELSKMMAAEKAKWENEKQAEVENARNEAERLAKLSKDERSAEMAKKRENELAERERKVQRSELLIETRDQLNNSGLPVEFAEMVMADDAEQIQNNIKVTKTAFDEAVEHEVNKRLLQKTPKNGGAGGTSMTKADIFAIKDTKERQQAIAEHIDLFGRN